MTDHQSMMSLVHDYIFRMMSILLSRVFFLVKKIDKQQYIPLHAGA